MKRLGIVAVAEHAHGGQFQYTQVFIQALCLVPGWQKTLYCRSGSEAYSNLGLPMRSLALGKVGAVLLAILRLFNLRAPDAFAAEDVVIAPMYTPQLLHTRTPFAYTLHDLQEFYYPEFFSIYQRVWRRVVLGRLAESAKKIICESEFVRRDIVEKYRAREDKVVVIAAPPLWEQFQDAKEADIQRARDRYRLPNQFLFYPAQFWAHKNHARLIAAFATIATEFPDVDIVFTGYRRYEYDRVLRQINALGLQDRVHVIGYINDNDIVAVYRLAIALVMPSLFESISIPVYEAFRVGTPVCSSNVLGLGAQIGDAGLTFDPMSVPEMTAAMRRILTDGDLRQRLTNLGKERLSAMTLQNYAAQLEQVLQQLAR